MGTGAVDIAVQLMKGEKKPSDFPKFIDSGATVITKDNVDEVVKKVGAHALTCTLGTRRTLLKGFEMEHLHSPLLSGSRNHQILRRSLCAGQSKFGNTGRRGSRASG